MTSVYPDAIGLAEFLDLQSRWLSARGFDPDASLAVTAACRDEMVADLRAGVRRRWHNAFDFSSLSGLPLSGLTGMRAVLDHAPQSGPRLEVVIFALPHIGILADGTPGYSLRRGRRDPTSACGSLNAAATWAQDVRDNPLAGEAPFDEMDPEQSLVRMHLLRHVPELADLDPVAVVGRVAQLMVDDLWSLVQDVTDPARVDVALVSGILVHGGDGDDSVDPSVVRIRTGGTVRESRGAFEEPDSSTTASVGAER